MLELKKLEMRPEANGRNPGLEMSFRVFHNIGALPTTLSADLKVVMEPGTGKARAELVLDDCEAEDLDAVRVKLSGWCARMAAALRDVKRVPFDVPQYERRTFNLATQPDWVQAEYARMAPRFIAISKNASDETRTSIRTEMYGTGNPILLIPGCYDDLEALSYAEA